ncbi:DegV family protein [Paenibacillus sp. P96]|uniref:DegV family protein n=1 Tax=Paenibacillus zeirhizosphaerae TaxID=2987519 RepID=A0ABT9FQ09_9BACL|nr:DegV family protein [Paenibacillus sp. P96]MDP4096810.1 DegV family protein [Paenibacillus sp. P96]
MSRTFIVTDSTADIPKELVNELHIRIVPLTVMFGEEAFLDGIEMTPERFYPELVKSKELPTTSQPSPAEFTRTYESILAAHPDAQIISIHLSSGLSGTYQSAVIGRSMLDDEQPVTVYDSKSASYGYGYLVVHAARMAAAGRETADIIRSLDELGQRRQLYFLVDTLEYLQKGGRIGKAAATIGTLLNIKPILSIDQDGVIYPVEKARGHKKAMNRIIDMLEQAIKGQKVNVVLGHTADPSTVEGLTDMLRSRFNVADVLYTEIGAVIGTHVGPGTIAVFVWSVGDEGS